MNPRFFILKADILKKIVPNGVNGDLQ